jgi:2-polyprenyl-3-methyl-5-hydroxy-6-metoxy-1,4-benzoquinol methylase
MKASNAWVSKLKNEGYEHHCSSLQDVKIAKKLGRIWRETIRRTKITPPSKLFELGCGGGRYLACLALNGYETYGIDVSPEVTTRCQNYLDEVTKLVTNNFSANVENSDIFTYESSSQYDLVYHFGVVEHFMEFSDRQLIWMKLYQLTKPNGWIMSAVPNGSHFWREKIRRERLCGYDVPEIDYSVALHEKEFIDAGLVDVIALPWNYFGFAEGMVSSGLLKSLTRILHISSNVIFPILPFPRTFKEKFAHGLLVLGRKPE